MTPITLTQASVLHLLIELLKGGRAEIIPELASIEPIEISEIAAALLEKTGVNHGTDAEAWCRWYLERSTNATEHGRETLKLMKKMLDDQEYYSKRIIRKRGLPNDRK